MAGGPEHLRQGVVRATVPLLCDYPILTTAQIARAAGIGEDELMAVFADKDTVLHACAAALVEHMSAVMDPRDEVRKLDAVRLDQPLAARLIEVLAIVDAFHHRVRADLRALERAVPTGTGAGPSAGRPELRYIDTLPEIRQAVARLLEPDVQHLRLPAAALAEAFLTMSAVGARTANEERPPLPAEQVVDLFLHGALDTH